MVQGQPEPIRFNLNERKATVAAALLLHLDGGVMDYMRLVKLMYFAEREAFDKLGRPITGDLYYSLDDGPILSTVLDLCKERRGSRIWDESIDKVSRWAVGLRHGFDESLIGPLSDAEVDVLRTISERHKDDDQWRLSMISHQQFGEYQDPHGSRLPIFPEEIMQAVGKSAEQIEELREEARQDVNVESIFGVF